MPMWVLAIGAYLLVRLIGVGVLALMAAVADEPFLDQFAPWDGQWYIDIAERGYFELGKTALDAERRPYSAAPFAFFPALPSAMSVVAVFGVPLPVAGVIVTTVAGLLAVPAIMRIAEHIDPRPRVGLVLVVLTSAAPMSITLSMVYTEALFMAAAAWALVGVLERRWCLAGACTLLAGLSRSTAVVLIAVVVAAAVWAMWREREGWRPLAAVALAPLGLLGWWAIVVVATTETWQAIELRGWNTEWDFGAEAVEWITATLTSEMRAWETIGAMIMVATVVLAVLLVRRVPWPLVAYGAGVVALTLGSSGLPFAKPRFVFVGLFVLLLPVAIGLVNRRASTLVAVLAGYVLIGTWLSAYSLTVWPHAI
ncbi:hypothetical protein AB8O38_03660 [Saccharomonospora xinjiangensis]